MDQVSYVVFLAPDTPTKCPLQPDSFMKMKFLKVKHILTRAPPSRALYAHGK